MCKDEQSAQSAGGINSGQTWKEGSEQAGNPDKKPDKEDSGGEIVYQNKDIASKFFAERLKGKSFDVYGLELPEVKEILPTNIPAVKVNELRLDNLLELADGSAAVVDYESEYRKASKVKYLNYLTGVVNRYAGEKQSCPYLRMIVIYTGDIRREQVGENFDVGAVKMKIQPAFLSEVDGDGIYCRLKEKVNRGERLSGREQMEFIIYPLTYRRKREKRKRIDEAVRLAAQIQDQEQQVFVLAGLLTFTDKVIDRETAEKIRRMIPMTKVAMIFEREKEEAVRAERQKTEAERQKAREAEKKTKEAEKEKQQMEKTLHEFIAKSIEAGAISLDKAAEYSGLDIAVVTKLAQGSL